jgi:hypothetical protein
MDSILLGEARNAVMCCMLFTTIIAVTAEAPAAVPEVFQRIWLRYRLFQETRRSTASGTSGEKFWEIDMTKFEP